MCTTDRTIKIYNVSGSAYQHTATIQEHEGPVWQVSWAHPKFGVILASASFDGSVLVHRENRPGEWTPIHKAIGLHESSVNGVAFAPHQAGLILATASSDGRIGILTHQPENRNDPWVVDYLRDNALGVNAVSWAPHGAYHDESDPDAIEPLRLVSGGCDNRIRFWIQGTDGQWQEDVSVGLDSSLSHSDWVRDVAWAPPILPGVNTVASCSEDGTVLVWTQQGKDAEWKPVLLNSFDSPVWKLSWSVTGHMLAVSSGDGDVSLWKAGLDGSWSKVGAVDDVAAGQTQQG